MLQTVEPTMAVLAEGGPQVDDGPATWVMRAANFVITRSQVAPGERLDRKGQADEYFVYFHTVGGRVSASGETADVGPETLVIVPPGDSEITASGDGQIFRVLSSRAEDLLKVALNRAAYEGGTGLSIPLRDGPMPKGGYRLRVYPMADYPITPDSHMRLFRTRNLMVNIFGYWKKPRDIHNLSPHSHDDFEQGSLALSGVWMHRLRFPWGKNLDVWKPDEHREVDSPSLMVIPPTVIHTSHNLSSGQLVDVFAPPRADFVGMARNKDDYGVELST